MKMTNYEIFKTFLTQFNKFNISNNFEVTLSDASYDDNNKVYVYDSSRKSLNVLNFDDFVQQVYLRNFFSTNEVQEFIKTKSLSMYSLASVDAFLIDKNGEWFFIEFKNQAIKNTKDSVEKKAYQNLFWITDLFLSDKANNKTFFDSSNPIEFSRKHITYILVVSKDKNFNDYEKIRGLELAGEKFRPIFMEKLKHYVYKDAYVYTEDLFESYFVKKFEY